MIITDMSRVPTEGLSSIEKILIHCSGVGTQLSETRKHWMNGRQLKVYDFFRLGDIKLVDEVYIEITGSATKGTIARVHDLEIETYYERYGRADEEKDKLVGVDATIIYEIDGRKQKGRINSSFIKVLEGKYKTKYVRNVTSHEKVVIKNPVNKFGQEMQRGDWAIGIKQGSRALAVGRITRWTNNNVWGITGDDLDIKEKEFMFNSIKETVTIPPDEASQLLTMAVLKGWDGK